MALPLPRAAALLLLLLLLAAPLLCAAQGPISQPPSSGTPTASPHINPDSPPADGDEGGKSISPSVAPAPAPADDGEKAASPPAPIETAPAEAPAPLHSTAAPAPAAEGEGYKKKKKKGKSPAPAPAAMEVKSSDGDERAQALDEAEKERREGMSGGKKAGVVVGVFSAVALVGLAAVVYKKRQANIRRSRYASSSSDC